MARTGLGAELERVIGSVVPPLLEPAGFTRLRGRRAWERTAGEATQLVAVNTDGRMARDGYLPVSVVVGVHYGWEPPSDGPVVAGRQMTHWPHPVNASMAIDPNWDFRSGGEAYIARELQRHLGEVVLPAVEAWAEPRSLMHHHMRRGHLEAAARLAHHLGERELARSLAAAYAEWKLRWLREHQPTQSPKSAADVLELAAEVGLGLRPEQDAALRQDLHAAAARMRQRTDVLPWVEELERRFPRP